MAPAIFLQRYAPMEDKSEREKRWLEEHERLSRLFVEDRLTFERERKRRIEKTINRVCSRTRRHRLRELQSNWDDILKHAGSEHNRFVLIQMLFWNQVRDVWTPALNTYEKRLKRNCSLSLNKSRTRLR